MFGVVVLIFFVFESVESSCFAEYSQLTNQPISSGLVSGHILKIPLEYYASCGAITTINLNAAAGKDVKLNSLDFVKYFQPSVTFLDASNNDITKLPRPVNAVHLRTIRLINNKINDITYINEFRYLESIDFSENKIKDLPEITLSNLHTLILRKNLLTSVRPWNLRATPNLRTLQLDENFLTETRICEFKNNISISVTKNPKFSCSNVSCNMCKCKDILGSVDRGREIDACPGKAELYFIVTAVVAVTLFSAVALICIIRWKRNINRRIQEESHNPLSMNSLPMTPLSPPPKYEFRDNQNGQFFEEMGPGNILNYDYVYSHLRKKRRQH